MMVKTSDYSVAVTSTALMLFLSSLLMHCATVAGTIHVVGDFSGWTVPIDTNFYNTWSSSNTFHLNDILTFNFAAGVHNVVEVPKGSYDSCSTDNEISEINIGPANVTLTETGTHYLICSYGGHCQAGQKMAVTVNSGQEAICLYI